MVSLRWVTYPEKEEKKNDGLIIMGDLPKERWSHYDGWPTQMKMMVSLWWVTCPDERCWSHYDGWPTQITDVGLIVMGDLPRWKMLVSLWWVTYPKKVMVSLWWVTYPKKDAKIFFKKNGLIVMGDLPRKDEEWSCCNGWPTQKKCWSHCNGWPTQGKYWWGLKGTLERR